MFERGAIMIYQSAQKLLDYALHNSLISPVDIYFVRNKLMEALCLSDWEETVSDFSPE